MLHLKKEGFRPSVSGTCWIPVGVFFLTLKGSSFSSNLARSTGLLTPIEYSSLIKSHPVSSAQMAPS